MNRINRLVTLGSLSVWLLFGVNPLFAASANDERVVATYEGGEVTAGELVTFIRRTERKLGVNDISLRKRQNHLRNLIYVKHFSELGVERGIDRDPGIIPDKTRYLLEYSGWLAQELVTKQAGEVLTEAEIKDYYDQHPEEFTNPVKFTFSYISFDTTACHYYGEDSEIEHLVSQVKERAALAADALRSGSDFVEVVLEYCRPPGEEGSEDSGGIPLPFGDQDGYKATAEIYPENAKSEKPSWRKIRPGIAERLFAMEPGEVSDPIELWNGYMIIALHDREDQGPQPFEEVRDGIEKKLKEQLGEAAIVKLVDEARRVAKIEKDYAVASNPSSATTDVVFSVAFFPEHLDYTVADLRNILEESAPSLREEAAEQMAEFLDGEVNRVLVWAGLNLKGIAGDYRPDLMALNHWQEDISRLAFYHYVNDHIRQWDPSDDEIERYWRDNPQRFTEPAATVAEVLGATVTRLFEASDAADKLVREYIRRTLSTLAGSKVGKTSLARVRSGIESPDALPRKRLDRILAMVEPEITNFRVNYLESVALDPKSLKGFKKEIRESIPDIPPGEALPEPMDRAVPLGVTGLDREIEVVALRVLEQIPERRIPLEEVRDSIVRALRAAYRETVKPDLEKHGYEPLEPKVDEDVLQSL